MSEQSFDEIAAQRKNPEECYQLATRYLQDCSVFTDKKAVIFFRRAAEAGFAPAQFKLARLYERGRGVDKDFKEAASWFIKAAERQHVPAQCHLGLLYAKGRGVPRDPKRSLFWYEQAATLGNLAAQNNLGLMYEFGYGTSKNAQQALFWYQQAANRNSENAKKSILRLTTKSKSLFEKIKDLFGLDTTVDGKNIANRFSDNDLSDDD